MAIMLHMVIAVGNVRSSLTVPYSSACVFIAEQTER